MEDQVIGISEGQVCGRNGCTSILEYKPVKNCSCHMSAPCSACVDNPLTCPECKWTEEDE